MEEVTSQRRIHWTFSISAVAAKMSQALAPFPSHMVGKLHGRRESYGNAGVSVGKRGRKQRPTY